MKWIKNPLADLSWIHFPLFLPVLAIFLFPDYFIEQNEVGPLSWLILVVFIDVAHVYATLFRTYMLKDFVKKYRSLFTYVPLISWVAGMMVYSMQPGLFWRLLAYLAVFHFIRQQYGFMRLYARHENLDKRSRFMDALAIYSATLYPILVWHLEGREFNWFVSGDFIALPDIPLWPFTVLYGAIQGGYVLLMAYRAWTTKQFNLPKFLIWFGTLLSWYVGIVLLNGDLTFTLCNVVAHGIPYIGLVWMRNPQRPAWSLKKPAIVLFLLLCAALAFFEEGLWNKLVWQDPEHGSFFAVFDFLPKAPVSWINIVVPLLAVPQITHYVLDAYIWKRNYTANNEV